MYKKLKKYKKSNPVIAMLKFQQALTDTPDATYIKIMGYRRYNDDPQVQFERGVPPLRNKSNKLEYKKWVITEWYIPINNEYKICKYMDFEALSIKIPKTSFVNVIVRDAKNQKIANSIKNHILLNWFSMYRLFPNSATPDSILLTEKNWEVINTYPNFERMIRASGAIPVEKYHMQPAFKKKIHDNNS